MCWSHLLSHTLRERGDCRLKPFLSHHPETPQAAIHSPVFKSLLHDVANESILCLTCLRIAPQGRNRSGNPEELLGSLVPSSHCIDGDMETQPGPHGEDPLSRAGSFAASGARLPGAGRAEGWRGGREEGERPARRFVHQTPTASWGACGLRGAEDVGPTRSPQAQHMQPGFGVRLPGRGGCRPPSRPDGYHSSPGPADISMRGPRPRLRAWGNSLSALPVHLRQGKPDKPANGVWVPATMKLRNSQQAELALLKINRPLGSVPQAC